VPYVLDPTLVRGLDYYTRTLFEIKGAYDKLGAGSTVVGGGRYDGLVAAVGGGDVPGIGFGAGLERLQLAIEREGSAPEPPPLDLFVVVEDPAHRAQVLPALARWRAEGRSADTDYAGRSMKGQLTQAQRSGAATTVVVHADGTIQLRRSGQEDVTVRDLGEV
jgi:histidyl-tRNA synthetase